ncbi:hypothetical protein GGTG_09345 [Gaeumannomyces tritici R3-111a-1]|uniref:Uncharacterized protein n=1 Tax=Gaeumannomyces tritici (strain R3-111a-1) TaxID=644352 RepID=J3P748_GAET3|nr:hypothetical protein GGTG_09345 [Gaeumannomyces tritici R3-111a-1]EJT72479.1 hypothetical protein GGTG_09345 [Gaeumannomyces tritici R3-111a-1]
MNELRHLKFPMSSPRCQVGLCHFIIGLYMATSGHFIDTDLPSFDAFSRPIVQRQISADGSGMRLPIMALSSWTCPAGTLAGARKKSDTRLAASKRASRIK